MKRNSFRVALTTLLLTMSLSVPAFAEGNLDDVINGNNAQEQVIQEESNFIDGLNDANNFTADVGKANEVTASAKPGFTLIVQLLTKLIVWGLTLRVLLDIAYVSLPFSRKLLGGGSSKPSQPASTGGFGGGGFGGSGFGGSGFGGSGASSSSAQASFWVSSAAIKASTSETPMRIYIKDMAVMLTVVPILLVLALTGILTQVGIVIGNVIVEALKGLSGVI